MPKPHILISMETYLETEVSEVGRQFLNRLMACDNRLAPELLSTSDRFKDTFVDEDDFLTNWWAMPVQMFEGNRFVGERFNGPSWKRKSALASRGKVGHGLIDIDYQRTLSDIWFEARWAKDVDFDSLFVEWSALAHPEIGMLHLFTEPELQWRDYEADQSFEVGSFGGPAKPGLPNMGWAMAYGKGYAAEVDAARIRAAGFAVDEHDGVTIVRVTEKLYDVVDDFERFSRRRAELKAMFRPDLFWIKQEPSEREIA